MRLEAERDRANATREPTLVFVHADRLEYVEAPATEEQHRVLSFAFAQYSARDGVVRSYWVGEARLQTDGGARRAICILETAPDATWRTSWRFVKYDSTLRRSEPFGPWHERAGAGPPRGFPFEGWLEPARLDAEQSGIDVRMGTGEIPFVAPESADTLLELVGGMLYSQIAAEGGLDCDVVVALTGKQFQLWEVRGRLPCSFDDLVRAVAYDTEADAVAVFQPEKGPGADVHIVARCEVGQHRAAQRLVMERREGRVVRSRIELLEDRAGSRWLGVSPDTAIELKALETPQIWGPVDGES